MKTTIKSLIAVLVLGASTWMLAAQDGPPPGEGGGRPPRGPGGQGGQGGGGPGMNGQRPPMSPLIGALDANHDGVIDATEIANASAALKTLDKNGDGKLTQDELRPPRPDRGGGPGGAQNERPQHPPPGN